MEEADEKFKVKAKKLDKGRTIKRRNKVLEKNKINKFNEEVFNKQKSRILKRDTMQTKINRRLQELANKKEKEKILEEKKQLKDFNNRLADDKKMMVDAFTKYFDDQITSTREKITEEKLNKKIVEQAEKKQLSQWKHDVNKKQKKKLNKYMNRLDQEDLRYEVENLDLDKMEDKLIQMYKKY
mmetsp:Transcript_19821/g.17517  ORF Transcript_19821/g.17517 Transcript_19821/m.17517 type:complete len:183 (+) Transcript_19821:116-664(+)